MMKLVLSLALSVCIRSNRVEAEARSRLPVGSSASTQAGWVTRARATATRWRSPPESSDGSMPDALRQSDLFQHGSGLRMCFSGFHAAYQQRHGDVFQRGEFRQQVVELIDETERTVAQFAALRFVHRGYILPQDIHTAAGDGVESTEQMQQGTLAGTGCADDGDTLTA